MTTRSPESDDAPAGLDIGRFRQIMGRFASGVTVITAHHNGVNVGMTCQSFFSLSLDPLLVAFSPSRASSTYPTIRAAGHFAVNILAEHQRELCASFSAPGIDRWAGVDWSPGETGSPVLHDVVATIECEIEAEHEAGDHYIVVGRVLGMTESPAHRPLLYFQGNYAVLEADA